MQERIRVANEKFSKVLDLIGISRDYGVRSVYGSFIEGLIRRDREMCREGFQSMEDNDFGFWN